MKNRILHVDMLRILSCFMIVCMHAPMPSDSSNGLFLSTLSYFTAPGLCLFFIISGALLLPVKVDTGTFLKKRMSKVLFPTLSFTFVYLGATMIQGSDINWLKTIISIPFSVQGHGILWFMYTLSGLYLLAPILSRWLNNASKREEEFYLFLWLITLCYPILKNVLEINESETGILYNFSGYVGYFVLGHYLCKYPYSITMKKLSVPTILVVAYPVACKLYGIKVDFYSLFWYLSIFVAILSIAIYLAVLKISSKLKMSDKFSSVVVLTSNLCFGIYLIHIFVMRYALWRLDCIIHIDNYVLQCSLISILTFLISWLAAYLISRLPFGDYIIGYKHIRKRD